MREAATRRAADLERRLMELDQALAAERRAHGIAARERETSRAGLARAESARNAESVARAALEDELDRERAARATLTEALEAAQSALIAAQVTQSDIVLSREQARAEAAAAQAELSRAASAEASARADHERAASAEASLRAELDVARSELHGARARIVDLEAELDAGRGALATAGRETGSLMARIAELERAAEGDLGDRARAQEEAAAAQPPAAERSDVSASLDAAAAALRARSAQSPDATEPPAPPRPRIVTEATHPARSHIVGSSKREYPWLRGAVVKLAHDDPRAATRLVLGLIPVQRALLNAPLEYDLTIRGSGTYAISVSEQAASARSVARRARVSRPRST